MKDDFKSFSFRPKINAIYCKFNLDFFSSIFWKCFCEYKSATGQIGLSTTPEIAFFIFCGFLMSPPFQKGTYTQKCDGNISKKTLKDAFYQNKAVSNTNLEISQHKTYSSSNSIPPSAPSPIHSAICSNKIFRMEYRTSWSKKDQT